MGEQRLTMVLTALRARLEPGAGADDVATLLAGEGYDGAEIGEILASHFPELLATGGARRGGAGFRVLGPHERGRFAPEAWGHLLSLSGRGDLDPAELEHVIERALMHIDGRIAVDDLRALLAGAGHEASQPAGSRATIH